MDPVKNDYTTDKHEKGSDSDVPYGHEHDIETGKNQLHKSLKSRHMQMIAIGKPESSVLRTAQRAKWNDTLLRFQMKNVVGKRFAKYHRLRGSIGAGLFVGSGAALSNGGPAPLVICFMVIGIMLLCTVNALGELAVLYPVNGAFYNYAVRFLDPAWGFAMGWDYAMSWLVTLPYELVAASVTISFWRDDINPGVWIAVFLVALVGIQFFGVRGYGEVEFFLSIIKIVACIGFIILGIIIDCGGVPTDNRGYIGAAYWHDPGAFRNGFKGFCSVFVTAAFAFGGTELVGLAAAEAADPRKTLPRATKQVFWRITFFYVVSLFLIGLIVRSDSDQLLNASGANTKASPFVLAIKYAGIKGLPSVFNAVITLSVLSVANSCAYGSTRTVQALAKGGMAPKFFEYIDRKGRPIFCVVLQLLCGLLAFTAESASYSTVFTWLLSIAGLANFFVWGSICLSHIRFRAGWKAQGRSLDQLPFQAQFGVAGSYVGFTIVVICLIATFYVSLFPLGSPASAENFFQNYLAACITILLYTGWKIYMFATGKGMFFVRAIDMDLDTGLRNLNLPGYVPEPKTWANLPRRVLRSLF
ncbi:MAG: hypothetical protein MMC23_005290 [Stictis urceolatum]|nr:hypothetical protein [Stictis urceolata]